jgi:hypothetical protein
MGTTSREARPKTEFPRSNGLRISELVIDPSLYNCEKTLNLPSTSFLNEPGWNIGTRNADIKVGGRKHMATKQSSKSLAQVSWLAVFVVLFGVLVCPAQARRLDGQFELGGLRLNQPLKLFRARFPGVVCGTPLDWDHVNRHTLDDPDNSGSLTCCIDDPKQVSAFSKFRVLSVDNNCQVLVAFEHERLESVHLAVDAPSVDLLLPDFVKLYGPVQHNVYMATRTGPVRLASWMPHDTTLELSEEVLRGEDLKIDPPIYNGSSEARIVLLDMYGFE